LYRDKVVFVRFRAPLHFYNTKLALVDTLTV
jgi:hypothetical protein